MKGALRRVPAALIRRLKVQTAHVDRFFKRQEIMPSSSTPLPHPLLLVCSFLVQIYISYFTGVALLGLEAGDSACAAAEMQKS